MTDEYEAIYNAYGGTHAEGDRQEAALELMEAARKSNTPSAIYRPDLYLDGDVWCALYGPDIQVGVCGFGSTPEEVMRAFDKAWWGGS